MITLLKSSVIVNGFDELFNILVVNNIQDK